MFRFVLLSAFALASAALGAASPGFAARFGELQKQLAAQPTNSALLFQLADLCHDEGVNNNKDAVKLAEKYLRELLRLDSSNAPALALLGSTYTMKGRDAFWPGTQISLVKEGNKMMDEAARLAPENFEVRIMRGLNNVRMPGFLKREEIARADLAWLWAKLQAQPNDHPDDLRQRVAHWYGVALKKARQTAEARAVWQTGLAINPRSSPGREIQKQLDKLK